MSLLTPEIKSMDKRKTSFLVLLFSHGWLTRRFLRILYFSSILELTDALNSQKGSLHHVHHVRWERGGEGAPEKRHILLLALPYVFFSQGWILISVQVCFSAFLLAKRKWAFTVLGTILNDGYVFTSFNLTLIILLFLLWQSLVHKRTRAGKTVKLFGQPSPLQCSPCYCLGFLSRHPTVVALLESVLCSGSFVMPWLLLNLPWFLVPEVPAGFEVISGRNKVGCLLLPRALCIALAANATLAQHLQCPATGDRALWESEVPQPWQGLGRLLTPPVPVLGGSLLHPYAFTRKVLDPSNAVMNMALQCAGNHSVSWEKSATIRNMV